MSSDFSCHLLQRCLLSKREYQKLMDKDQELDRLAPLLPKNHFQLLEKKKNLLKFLDYLNNFTDLLDVLRLALTNQNRDHSKMPQQSKSELIQFELNFDFIFNFGFIASLDQLESYFADSSNTKTKDRIIDVFKLIVDMVKEIKLCERHLEKALMKILISIKFNVN